MSPVPPGPPAPSAGGAVAPEPPAPLGFLGFLSLPRIRAFDAASNHPHCVIEHSYAPLGIFAAQSDTRAVPPRIPVAQSNSHARYLAPSSCYRASLSHTRRPCA